jgi:uncharacterized membrane protein
MSKKSLLKRKIEKEKRDKQKKIFIAVVLGLILAFVVVGVVLYKVLGSDNNTVYSDSNVDSTQQNVVVNTQELSDGNFHFYSYSSDGVDIKYFLVKDSSGTVHSAFDACDVCYKEKKGYEQDGDLAKCRNCGKTFSVTDIGVKNQGSSCWPGYLEHTLSDGKAMIKISDLQKGEYYFK